LPAWLGEGLVASAAGSCLVTIATLLAVIADVRLRYPDMAWKVLWPPLDELRGRVHDALGYLVSPLTITAMVNGPTLILAHSGAEQGAIALFTTTRTIAGVARQLPYQFAHPAGVELAGLLARGDHATLSRVYERACRGLAIVVGVLSGITVVAAPLVMVLWTRGKVDYDLDLMLLLVGTTAVCAPAQVAYTLLWYGGRPRLLSKALIFSTALAMGLAFLLAPRFGTLGVALGLGIGEIVGVAVYLSLLVDRLLGRHGGTGLVTNFCASLVSSLSSAALGYLLNRLIEPGGWFGLAELGITWSIPAAGALYLVMLNGSQKARVAAAVMSFVRARGRSRA
jgi:O-antigen/teichoic acid export membrane protein